MSRVIAVKPACIATIGVKVGGYIEILLVSFIVSWMPSKKRVI